MGRYDSLKTKKKHKEYGETLFKYLFILFLIVGITGIIAGWLLMGWMDPLMISGIGLVLSSFVYKFMQKTIQLLKEILVLIKEK